MSAEYKLEVCACLKRKELIAAAERDLGRFTSQIPDLSIEYETHRIPLISGIDPPLMFVCGVPGCQVKFTNLLVIEKGKISGIKSFHTIWDGCCIKNC